MDKTEKLFNILRLYNIEERIFGELLDDLDQLINSVKEDEQNRIIRIIKGRLLIKKIRNPIIRLIQIKE